MNRKIIVALIIIVLIALVGIFALSENAKADTEITFLTGNTLKDGDQIQFELKDAKGTLLENQKITISFTANGQAQTYTITTDAQGKGFVTLNNVDSGTYNITVSYDGNDKYNGCSASQTITVGDEDSAIGEDSSQSSQESDSDTTNSDTSDNSASSELNYDSELNVYYDSNGKIVGGQNDGEDYDYLVNNPPEVVNGSLD